MMQTLSPWMPLPQRMEWESSIETPPALRVLFAVSGIEEKSFFGDRPGIPSSFHCDTTGSRNWKPGEWRAVLEETRPDVLVSCWSTPALPADWLDTAGSNLAYVCHLTGSVRALLPRKFLERGGLVTNWGDSVAPQVAEHALLLVLCGLRNQPAWSRRRWDCKYTTHTLYGKTVGLHGFGRIARALLPLLAPFGVRLRAYSSGVPAAFIRSHKVEPCDSLEELFTGTDILIECEALTPESEGSVTAAIMALLPDAGVFVNVGRGQVVDETALAAEAESGRLRVGLDVVSVEPLADDSPLARSQNIIYSPHIAGPTGDRFHVAGEMALRNIAAYQNGRPVEAEVTLEIYDRST